MQARNWLANAQYEDKHDIYNHSSEMTVDSWFEFWITNLIADLASNTRRNYWERYRTNIQPIIGKMRMCDVKPMHLSPKPSNSSSKTPVWQVKKWCAAEKIGAELVRRASP